MKVETHPVDRQDYVELDSIEDAYPLAVKNKWNIFQVKYDGIWARIVIERNEVIIYSRTGQVKDTFALTSPEFAALAESRFVLVGEYMFGSQWAQDESRKGLIYCFDCICYDSNSTVQMPYKDRYRLMLSLVRRLGGPFRVVECGGASHLGGFWLRLEQKRDVEGVVLRHWDHDYFQPLHKLKRLVQDDFVIMGILPGTGKYTHSLGSLVVGQYAPEGGLVEVMKVGGGFDDTTRQRMYDNPSEYLGRVILAEGKCRFESGALRSPQFIEMRSDKRPDECLLKRTLQS